MTLHATCPQPSLRPVGIVGLLLVLAAAAAPACSESGADAPRDVSFEHISTTYDDTHMTVTVKAGSGIEEFRVNGLPYQGLEYKESIIGKPGDQPGHYVAKVPLRRLVPGTVKATLVGVNGTPKPVILPFEFEPPTHLGMSHLGKIALGKDQEITGWHLQPATEDAPRIYGKLDWGLKMHLRLSGSPGVKLTVLGASATFDDKGEATLAVDMTEFLGKTDYSGVVQGWSGFRTSKVPMPQTPIVFQLSQGDRSRTLEYRLPGGNESSRTAFRIAAAYAQVTKLAGAPKDGGSLLVVLADERPWAMSRNAGKLEDFARIGVGDERYERINCGTYTSVTGGDSVRMGAKGVDISIWSYRAGKKPRSRYLDNAGRRGCSSMYTVQEKKLVYPSDRKFSRFLDRG